MPLLFYRSDLGLELVLRISWSSFFVVDTAVSFIDPIWAGEQYWLIAYRMSSWGLSIILNTWFSMVLMIADQAIERSSNTWISTTANNWYRSLCVMTSLSPWPLVLLVQVSISAVKGVAWSADTLQLMSLCQLLYYTVFPVLPGSMFVVDCFVVHVSAVWTWFREVVADP